MQRRQTHRAADILQPVIQLNANDVIIFLFENPIHSNTGYIFRLNMIRIPRSIIKLSNDISMPKCNDSSGLWILTCSDPFWAVLDLHCPWLHRCMNRDRHGLRTTVNTWTDVTTCHQTIAMPYMHVKVEVDQYLKCCNATKPLGIPFVTCQVEGCPSPTLVP